MLSHSYRPAPQALQRLRDVDFAAVVGPSAVGKTTLIHAATRRDPSLSLVLNNTSRAPRPDERDGADYRFETRERMLERIQRGEYAQVAPALFGDLYATAAEDYATEGIALLPVLADAVAGFRALPFKSVRVVFVLPPSWAVWRQRLAGHKFTPERLAKRLGEARRSLKFASDDPAVRFVINDNLDLATSDFIMAATNCGDFSPRRFHQERATALVHKLIDALARETGATVAPPELSHAPDGQVPAGTTPAGT